MSDPEWIFAVMPAVFSAAFVIYAVALIDPRTRTKGQDDG